MGRRANVPTHLQIPGGSRCPAPVPLKTIGSCLECHDGTPADPNRYTFPAPDPHRLAV